MRQERKDDAILAGFSETLFDGKAKRIVLDTGPPQNGKYRVVADLKKRKCPRCGDVHYSSWLHDYCIECHVIVHWEKKLGRKLTLEEAKQALHDTGLLD